MSLWWLEEIVKLWGLFFAVGSLTVWVYACRTFREENENDDWFGFYIIDTAMPLAVIDLFLSSNISRVDGYEMVARIGWVCLPFIVLAWAYALWREGGHREKWAKPTAQVCLFLLGLLCLHRSIAWLESSSGFGAFVYFLILSAAAAWGCICFNRDHRMKIQLAQRAKMDAEAARRPKPERPAASDAKLSPSPEGAVIIRHPAFDFDVPPQRR